MKEHIQIFIGWIVSLFVSEWQEIEYNGRLVKSNVNEETFASILDGKGHQYIESITIIYHDKVEKEMSPRDWYIFGSNIVKNFHGIKVRVNYKP